MRHPMLLSAVICVVTAAPALAQNYQGEMPIIVKEIEVRSGPSKNFFPTSKLYQNEKVLVLRESKEAPGWLEIKPPTGSFSWINAKYVKRVDARHGFVDCDPARPVSVLPGSRLVNQAPDRESVKLTAGTIIVINNAPMTVDSETWLPVEPHSSEVRYIPKEAVSPAGAVAPTNAGPPNWTQSPNGYSGNSVLAEAAQAEKANDIARARQLYQIVANNATDQNQKVYALNRLDALAKAPVQGTTTSLSPANPAAPIAPVQTLQGAAWSTYGRLRDSALKDASGQRIYGLEDAQGKTIYITTNPGKSLDMYLGRMIAVYGPTLYRPDVRMQYVLASHVAMP